jgi:UTP--glucose-1-phosphate uridylyltransferase
MKRIRKAIIPAAGLGTRFLPATKVMPKEMLPIVDKPTIQYIVEEAIQSGIEDIAIVTSRTKRLIEDHFDRNLELEMKLGKTKNARMLKTLDEITRLCDIQFVRQKEPLGLGHAIWCARKFVGNEPFAILLGDIIIPDEYPCLKPLLAKYEQYGSSVIAIQSIPEHEASKFGIIDGDPIADGMYAVRRLVEKPQQNPPSQFAILGRYILNPSIFDVLERTKPGAGGEIQLTDALNELTLKEELLAYSYEGRLYDVGNKLGFLMATVEFAYRNEELRAPFDEYIRTFLAGKSS